jgi:hypothetical protein
LDFARDLLARAPGIDDSELTPFFERELQAHMETAAQAQGLRLTDPDRELLRLDIELNAQGLAHVVLKGRKSASG